MKNKQLISLLPIHTKRLILKKTTINDVDLILKMDKQEETQKFLGGIKNKTKEERIEFLRKKEEKYKEGYASSLTVFLKTNTPIGFVGLKINEENNSGEISYIFDYDYWKKGYCTEIIEKIIDISFNTLNLEKITAEVLLENNNSSNLLEKLGFKKEIKKDNQFNNYYLLRKDYK